MRYLFRITAKTNKKKKNLCKFMSAKYRNETKLKS